MSSSGSCTSRVLVAAAIMTVLKERGFIKKNEKNLKRQKTKSKSKSKSKKSNQIKTPTVLTKTVLLVSPCSKIIKRENE